ncbi:MAG: LVIVD repeat-containing protein [Candidatus Cyclobacteriaceae bacterium M3_2C_046]
MKKIILNILAGFALWSGMHGCAENDAMVLQDSNGTGGSMARFTIANDYLYVVDHTSLKYFDISNALSPDFRGDIRIDQGIETVFPYQGNLFIGGRNGMYIFNISNPDKPIQLSSYSHLTSCDPVVVQEDFAYVTLRVGSECRWGANGSSALDVLDISNLEQPNLLTSFPLDEPYGLGVSDSLLFVCQGNQGLNLFSLKDPANPIFRRQISSSFSYDVIPLKKQKILILTGNDGIEQYNYKDPDSIYMLSRIPVISLEDIQNE